MFKQNKYLCKLVHFVFTEHAHGHPHTEIGAEKALEMDTENMYSDCLWTTPKKPYGY